MSFNGTGIFYINTPGQPVVTGTTITSTAFNALTTDLGTGLTNCLTKDGQSTPTANIKMGNYKLTGLGVATTTGDALSFGNLATISTLTLTNALGVSSGGTGQSTYTNGQLLIGNTTGNTLTKATLTAGTNVSITNGTGSITINATDQFSGTVTSVAQSFTGGLISVAGSPITTSGTLALTVAGTSGGIPYFSSASTWATSAVLAANALVVGGGAGVTPATVTTGTGVVTALGVNVGTAGAVVVNGGVLGTPSSGTVTNLTGTASININGTVGATTPTTGAFTTLTATSITGLTTPLTTGQGGTGQSTYTNGQLLIGNTTGNTLTKATLTAGSGITITNSTGSITIAATAAPTAVTGLSAAIGPTIADFFTSTLSLDASSIYIIECQAFILKTTAGTVTWTWTYSSAPTFANSFVQTNPGGITLVSNANSSTPTGGSVIIAGQATAAHLASAALTDALYYGFRFKVNIRTNAATTLQLRATESAGTITPQVGSFMSATKVA